MRSNLILSKGHAGSALYAVLAHIGCIELSQLKTYYQDNTKLSGHISSHHVHGIDWSTGSLGHGLLVATGLALAAKLDSIPKQVFTILGDGEVAEGTT